MEYIYIINRRDLLNTNIYNPILIDILLDKLKNL